MGIKSVLLVEERPINRERSHQNLIQLELIKKTVSGDARTISGIDMGVATFTLLMEGQNIFVGQGRVCIV